MKINLKLNDDVEIEVSGNYEAGESPTYYPVDNADPGYPSIFEINEIKLIKGTLLDFLINFNDESFKLIEYIEQECLNKIE